MEDKKENESEINKINENEKEKIDENKENNNMSKIALEKETKKEDENKNENISKEIKEEDKNKNENIPKEIKEEDKNNKNINNLYKNNEEKKKEKERKKQEKKEKQQKFLNKKHKSPEEQEYEKMFLENNKILINFLGDSITEGLKWQKKEIFCFYLSKWLNIKVNNQGYHATRIARQDDDDKDFNYRLKDLDEKADFTFIFGGTNDYGMGEAEIGDINSDSNYTFYGAVKNLVRDLLKKFTNDKICFILPLSRFEEDKVVTHGPLSKYRDIIKEICDLNKIDYLDLCKELPIPATDGKTELFKDGLHPNKQGHKIIARNIIKYLKNKGIINKNFEYKE